MSDQAPSAAQPFPPGLSRLERLPDELKLRVGCFLTGPAAVKVLSETNDLERDDYGFFDWHPSADELYMSEVLDDTSTYNDTMLALAATSTRLCNVFFNEHSKEYGIQNTLYRSIELGCVGLVHRAVEHGADINEVGARVPYQWNAMQIAVYSEQLPVILYLLRRGVDKVDELVMDILRDSEYHERSIGRDITLLLYEDDPDLNHSRCRLLRALMKVALGNSQAPPTTPRLPREVREALVPNGLHLWFILRTCMRREWGCDCRDKEAGECPMRLISLLQRHGANWTPCGAYETVPKVFSSWHSLYSSVQDARVGIGSIQHVCKGRGAADLQRIMLCMNDGRVLRPNDGAPLFVKPSVAGAMDRALLGNAAYKRDHCLPFLTAILESGVAAELGDLEYAMNLSCKQADEALSIAIVRVLLQGGTDANEPRAMQTAMRLACFHTTRDAAVAFVTLLLEHGADPSLEELQDEIQGTVEKWWVQSAWQSSSVFLQILDLLADGGLDLPVVEEILALLSLNHNTLAEATGDSVEV